MINGEEVDLDEKLCAIRYKIFTDSNCKKEFNGKKTDKPMASLKKYGECHKAPLLKYSSSFYTGNFALISCKKKNQIQMQRCDSYNQKVGTVDTFKNGECRPMMDDLLKYYLIIEAKETTAGEVLGALVGVCIACCVCIAVGAFIKKKMSEKADDAVNKFGEDDTEMAKIHPPVNPATPPPQMGQPQQQMYGQQPMMQQPMGMGMQ